MIDIAKQRKSPLHDKLSQANGNHAFYFRGFPRHNFAPPKKKKDPQDLKTV
jgi:hypothetical protein